MHRLNPNSTSSTFHCSSPSPLSSRLRAHLSRRDAATQHKGGPSPRRTPGKWPLLSLAPSLARTGPALDENEYELAEDYNCPITPLPTQRVLFRTQRSSAKPIPRPNGARVPEDSSGDELGFTPSADISRAPLTIPARKALKRHMGGSAAPPSAGSPMTGSPTKRRRRTPARLLLPPQTPNSVRNFAANTEVSTPASMVFSPEEVDIAPRSLSPSLVIRRYRSINPRLPHVADDSKIDHAEGGEANVTSQVIEDLESPEPCIVEPLSEKQRGKLAEIISLSTAPCGGTESEDRFFDSPSRSMTPWPARFSDNPESVDDDDDDDGWGDEDNGASYGSGNIDVPDVGIIALLSDKQLGKLPGITPRSPIPPHEPEAEDSLLVPPSSPPTPPATPPVPIRTGPEQPEDHHDPFLPFLPFSPSPPESTTPIDEDNDTPQTPPREPPPRSQFSTPRRLEPTPVPLANIWNLPSLPHYGPACLLCKKASILKRVSPINHQNRFRPYYKCVGCAPPGFVTFADKEGIDPGNPTCECGKPSRKQITTKSEKLGPKVPFLCCAEGVCGFWQRVD
ncbi:hypothetical protein B0T14DRAFT_520558 [Immersiella caudata]|uniref:GRF-like zinc ribbon domain-containing protein n=1 Tax=Immersiella caudata TaxID=314043 RepID=A0AA39WR61_9PEZI|nr:hypothetical protein B0T14DRAFT_520558 [Immersiella caudata]